MKRIVRMITVLLITAALLSPLPAAARTNAISEARKGVVRILSVEGRQYATGSGVAVGEAGKPASIFVTNNHVIAGAREIYILLDNKWEESVPAFGGKEDGIHAVRCEVISTPGANPDYAILKASRQVSERVAQPLMPSRNAAPGETIYALGFPGVADFVSAGELASVDDVTITSGTISRFVTEDATNTRCIQIDADINPGNSGGPLVTEEGYVIGLNTKYYYDGQNDASRKIFLAIEIDYLVDELNRLIANGKLPGFSFTLIEDPEDGGDAPVQPAPAQSVPPAEQEEPRNDTTPTETEPGTPKQEPKKEGPNTVLIIAAVVTVLCTVAAVVAVAKKRQSRPAHSEIQLPPPPPPKRDSETDIAQDSARAEKIPVPPPVQETNHYLKCLDGVYAGKKIAVKKDMVLGRNSDCDIPFPSGTPGVSGRHCMVSPRPNGIVVIDLGSTYGTHTPTSGKLAPNQKYLLRPGDVFQVGNAQQSFQVALRSGAAEPAAAPGQAALHITALTGPLAGRRFPLDRNLRIGRSAGSDILFPEGTPGISGSHCMLIPQGNLVYLTDLGSSYGTFLENGSKLAPQEKHPLRKGDVFYLASQKQSFRID